MSRRNQDTRRSTAARPGTRVTPCRSNTANGSKRLAAGPRPSVAWPRPSIAESKGCVPASSSPWPQTTSPGCPGCSPLDAGKPRHAHSSPASRDAETKCRWLRRKKTVPRRRLLQHPVRKRGNSASARNCAATPCLCVDENRASYQIASGSHREICGNRVKSVSAAHMMRKNGIVTRAIR